MLSQLALPGMATLLERIDHDRLAIDSEALGRRIAEARQAANAGDSPKLVDSLRQLLRSFPSAEDRVRPLLGSYPEFEAALRIVAAEMQTDVEARVRQAAWFVETGGTAPRSPDGTDPGTMLAVAMRFLETGRLPDLVRAGGLADVVIAGCRARRQPWTARAAAWAGALACGGRRLWVRAPLLFLLLAWLALGLSGVLSADAWALGFLALVSLGFLARVR